MMVSIVYDKYESALFDDGKTHCLHAHPYHIVESSKKLIIRTPIVIDGVRRGWVGDITLNLNGIDIYNFTEEDKHLEHIVYKDVLCARILYNQYEDDSVIELEYHFLKY